MTQEEKEFEMNKAVTFIQMFNLTDDEDLREQVKKAALNSLIKLNGDE